MRKVLVANRGEIAARIIRSVQEMGIKTVAIYSTADEDAPFVRLADEAVWIGESPSSESYLQADRIIEVAKKHNVDGIHPGYGFLSENDSFSKSVTDSGLKFIGPGPKAIWLMGDKIEAKKALEGSKVPLVPGTDYPVDDTEKAIEIAKNIGYPLLIKAAAGGGGKGMRMVKEESELASQMERAISEARSAFGNGAVFIEKFISNPKHIEIQVLADTHGNVIHLFERECSIQRRHQKVVEEAPSPSIDHKTRMKMGAAAVEVAKACGYIGAGTVEFLMDDQKNYYFLEMNTRLQVEHPVTEWITGVDLVKEQIHIARGEKLRIKQEELSITGHAIELRVYAEDPFNEFLPSTGLLKRYRPPSGPRIRVDDGFREGMEVPIYYDPMLSKLIVYGADRIAAMEELIRAIENYEIQGVETTLPFGRFVMNHPVFRDGSFTTHFVEKYFTESALEKEREADAHVAAAFALDLFRNEVKRAKRIPSHNGQTWWQRRPYEGDKV